MGPDSHLDNSQCPILLLSLPLYTYITVNRKSIVILICFYYFYQVDNHVKLTC